MRFFGSIAVTALLAGVSPIAAGIAYAADEKPSLSPAYSKAVSNGIAYLTSQQEENGAIAPQAGPAITALAVTALIRHGRGVNDPVVAKGLKYVEGFVQPNGGVYQKDSLYQNYETCVAIVCFKEANASGKYDKLIKDADKYVKKIQFDESEEKDEADPFFGGAGYGKHQRPDLSNTQFLVEALKAAGNGPDDENLKKALVFVSRCQNLESEHNTTKYPALNEDGGFYYSVADGSSQAGKLDNGGLRSYASMTYAGLKSMIYAGVSADDPRVKAALEWIAKNYDLKTNPGLGPKGLYYYYHTFAKTMEVAGIDQFKDAEGKLHDWRRELIEELAGRQREDGSWVNDDDKWMEGEGELVTCYCLLALSHCKPKVSGKQVPKPTSGTR